MSETSTAAPPAPPPPPTQTTGPVPPQPPRRSGGGTTWGLILIAVGILLLVGRFLPMYSLWSFWPLIIIAAGVVQAVTPGREGWSIAKLFDGLVTVAFGGVFLAITTGIVGWGVWSRIVVFWPVLIVAFGLEILGKALHSSWPKVLGSLAIIAALAYSVALSASGTDSVFVRDAGAGDAEYSISEPVGSIDEAELKLTAGAASVRMAAGSDLVDVTGNSPFGEPSIEVDSGSTPANVDVRLGDGDRVMMWPGDFSADYDVTLSDDVRWDLAIDVGVSDFSADFSDLELVGLRLKPGVTDCDVRVGDVPSDVDEGRISVEAGISSVVLMLPEDTPARVQIESGISGNSVRGAFRNVGRGVWETPDYDDAKDSGEPVWLVTVKSGIGSITVDTY